MFGASSSTVDPAGRTVLVTGASSGLGREAALGLARAGFQVVAGVRALDDGERLAEEAAARLRPVLLDVTEPESVAAAAEQVARAVGVRGLWGLVNNAGICVSAPLECVAPEVLRRQLDVNVVGQLAVTQAVLPLLRDARGRVVNVTSGVGNVAVPYLGAYAAAQFAKEGMSDALRRELRPLGVDVSVVQPGSIMTPIWGKIAESGHDVLDRVPAEIADLYRESFPRFLEANEKTAIASKTTPADFARTVRRALTAARPKTRYRVGTDARTVAVLARLLPDSLLDRQFRAVVGPPRTAAGDPAGNRLRPV
ncbi:SDR family oxidoreductase [Actinokineospora sp.]|uniref:SDR family oxidoreductase n=1 Tax=Actinokineospora sp. TaxID=1872133 RepID=UPI003D6B44E0